MRKSKQSEWCVNFNGLVNDTCEAGHIYTHMMRSLTDEEQVDLDQRQRSQYPVRWPKRFAIIDRIPCFKHNNGCPDCPDLRFPTSEELE